MAEQSTALMLQNRLTEHGLARTLARSGFETIASDAYSQKIGSKSQDMMAASVAAIHSQIDASHMVVESIHVRYA